MSSPSLSSSGDAIDVRERLNLDPTHWGVQALAEVGVAVALAAVLGQLRLFMMPQGGSVSLEALPIIFVAVRRGVVPGATAGLLYGLLQLVLPGAFVYQPFQAALDYPLAFMALGAAGFVDVRSWRTLSLAVFAAFTARFCFHFASGAIYFASYAPQWENWWMYAATYNLLYLVPEGVLTTLLLWPLLKAYDAAFPGRGRTAQP
ncbi:MAG TPA: energy-coupled thiamine transporter ThiT [Thermoleophilia bacterium]|nr:energy-coupled thiamine transporter ThiT [Thermoleophilia bacterium]